MIFETLKLWNFETLEPRNQETSNQETKTPKTKKPRDQETYPLNGLFYGAKLVGSPLFLRINSGICTPLEACWNRSTKQTVNPRTQAKHNNLSDFQR